MDSLEAPICRTRADVRHYLELSTAHLPQELIGRLDKSPGVLSWSHDLGSYLYVPTNESELDDMAKEGSPAEILVVMRYAMGLGCSLVDLRRDIDPVPDLPVFADDVQPAVPEQPQVTQGWEATPTAAPQQPQPAQAWTAAPAETVAPSSGGQWATPALPPAGWYPDPYGQARLRWWDGNQWTPHHSS